MSLTPRLGAVLGDGLQVFAEVSARDLLLTARFWSSGEEKVTSWIKT